MRCTPLVLLLVVACAPIPEMTYTTGEAGTSGGDADDADAPEPVARAGDAGATTADAEPQSPDAATTCAPGAGVDLCCGAVPCVGKLCFIHCAECARCAGSICCVPPNGKSATCADAVAACGHGAG